MTKTKPRPSITRVKTVGTVKPRTLSLLVVALISVDLGGNVREVAEARRKITNNGVSNDAKKRRERGPAIAPADSSSLRQPACGYVGQRRHTIPTGRSSSAPVSLIGDACTCLPYLCMRRLIVRGCVGVRSVFTLLADGADCRVSFFGSDCKGVLRSIGLVRGRMEKNTTATGHSDSAAVFFTGKQVCPVLSVVFRMRKADVALVGAITDAVVKLKPLTMRLITALCLALCISSAVGAAKNPSLISLNEEIWEDVLAGEWMIEFHAPWCPACKDLQKAWNAFAGWSKDLNIKVAEVDVTTNPGLSGRFLVTALPTIYHVKDGVFRPYQGPRDKNNFISFIEDKRWSAIDPLPSYKHPNSPQMTVVAYFFKLSMAVRDFHNNLVENHGVPSWASYTGFATVTLALGCVLGFLIVCVIDYVFPTGLAAQAAARAAAQKKKAGKSKAEKSNDTKSEDKPESKKAK
uniref:Thioredoxin-related transmembrane protein 1 n=1 Tax=Panagrellus redivivus TaxID=6233 RepID=A0A7E4VNY9_PANRE